MKITLTGTDFNRIMRVCGPAVSKDDVRESLQHIELQCNGRTGGPGRRMRHGLRWLYPGANPFPLPGRAGHRDDSPL